MTNRNVILRIFGVCCTAAIAASAWADVPRKIHYQGKLRETSGALTNGNVALQLKLYDNANGAGAPLFTETHSAVPVSNGLFNVLIGSQTSGGVPDSALNAAEVYLGISVNGTSEVTPRPQVVSDPHAIKAKSSEQLVKPGTFAPAAVVDSAGKVGIGTSTPQAALDISSDGSTVLVPRKSSSGDPDTPINGMIYYNSISGKFRGYENGSWGDMRDGSGSASDPCNCPANPWSLVGVLNTTVGASGEQSSGIDISDSQKEYLILSSGSASATEFTVADTGASFVVNAANSLSSDVPDYTGAVLDQSSTWRTVSADSTDRCVIRTGATWSGLGTPALMRNGVGSGSIFGRVYSNGTIRIFDGDSGSDGIVAVFSRNP